MSQVKTKRKASQFNLSIQAMSSVRALNMKKHSRLAGINDLPAIIVQCILECIPLRDAVRTSVLSKEWRHHWKSLSHLVVDSDFFDSIPCGKEHYILYYAKVVSKVISSQMEPVHKLVLYIPFDESHFYPCTYNYWLQLTAKIGVKDLTLQQSYYSFTRKPLAIPDDIFSCPELTHLSLCYFTLNPLPLSFRGFPHLIRLRLEIITRQTCMATIEDLLSRCCKLREFYLDILNSKDGPLYGEDIQSLKLSAATAEMKTVCLTMKDISCCKIELADVLELFKNLSNVEKLDINYYYLEALCYEVEFPRELPTLLSRLETLTFDGRPYEKICDWEQLSFMICLIRSSPNLQQLDMFVNSYPGPCDEEIAEDCRLGKLRTVKLHDVSGRSMELKVIKFLLACSPVLEVMSLVLHPILKTRKFKVIGKELSKLYRASPKAKIQFYTLDCWCDEADKLVPWPRPASS